MDILYENAKLKTALKQTSWEMIILGVLLAIITLCWTLDVHSVRKELAECKEPASAERRASKHFNAPCVYGVNNCIDTVNGDTLQIGDLAWATESGVVFFYQLVASTNKPTLPGLIKPRVNGDGLRWMLVSMDNAKQVSASMIAEEGITND